MPLDRIAFDPRTAQTELASFKAWMAPRAFFSETEAVTEIKLRRHMACLLGYSILMPRPDLIKFEFGVRGLFKADLVIGNDASRKFVLVEFEGGQANSIFSGGTANYRYWARPIEHGFGQVIDWGWAKHDHPNDTIFTNAFGDRIVDDSYVVVCGRSPAAGSIEEKRFDFRRSRVKLSGNTVQFLTYDDMVNAMSDNLVAVRW
jgi:hypothetical protein